MKPEKFLTVYAVFDVQTQSKLKVLQDSVLGLGLTGTQTMGIPFHISLGSFPPARAEELKQKIEKVCSETFEFEIRLGSVGCFGSSSVLFVEPVVNTELRELQREFDGNFADGFPWHAHTTIFCGEGEEVIKAKEHLEKIFVPFSAKVVGIELGEFFPAKILLFHNLVNNQS